MLKEPTTQIVCDPNIEITISEAAQNIREMHKDRMTLAIIDKKILLTASGTDL